MTQGCFLRGSELSCNMYQQRKKPRCALGLVETQKQVPDALHGKGSVRYLERKTASFGSIQRHWGRSF